MCIDIVATVHYHHPMAQITTDNTWGDRLEALRIERGLSRIELAQLAGVAETTIWRFETSRHGPSYDVLRRIARALGVSVGDILPVEGS